GLCLLIFLCNLFGCSTANKTTGISEKKDNAATRLKIKMKSGETHHYSIYIEAGEFAHITAIQYNIDVMAKVTSSGGEYSEMFDSPTGELDAEDIYLVGGMKYEIEIFPAQKYADPGEYSISIVKLGKETETDKKWMAALASTQKSDKLRAKADTRLQSILQYDLAAAEWMALKDTVQYAKTMRSLGFVFIRLKNYEKAVDVFSQLLPVWKQLGDTRSEVFTYLIIGRVYDIQKNYKKSLEYNLNSLPISAKINDTDQESFTLMNIGDLYAHLSDKQNAIHSFEQALKKNEHSERPSIKAVILRDYATAMLWVGENEKAVILYEQSLKQWQATANIFEEAKTAVLLAAYFGEKGNKQQAVQYYTHALAIWNKLDEQNEIQAVQIALNKL
ncbi:MAG: tetratricopeptide repeat protein, partial [Chitinophagaceae bacterium]